MNVEKLTRVNPIEIAMIFLKRTVQFPRMLRIEALREVIKPILEEQYNTLIKKEKESEKSLSLGEMKKKLRYANPDHLSELQLEIEYEALKNEELEQTYLLLFWESVVSYLKTINGEFVINEMLALEEEEDANKYRSITDYNDIFKNFFRDDDEFLDGVHYSEYRSYLYVSTNVKELYRLGLKYDLAIPKYFTKDQLKDRLVNALKEKEVLTPQLEQEVQTLDSKAIKAKLEDVGANAKTYFTKEEIIEYILKNNRQLKNYYQQPLGEIRYGIEENNEKCTKKMNELEQQLGICETKFASCQQKEVVLDSKLFTISRVGLSTVGLVIGFAIGYLM